MFPKELWYHPIQFDKPQRALPRRLIEFLNLLLVRNQVKEEIPLDGLGMMIVDPVNTGVVHPDPLPNQHQKT